MSGSGKIGIIAGSGRFPCLLNATRAQGFELMMAAINEERIFGK